MNYAEFMTRAMQMEEFVPFQKIPRLSRECTITEKIDGTNAAVRVYDDGSVRAASRTRWITPQDDNFGFARWVEENTEELRKLGVGLHFGEWWGQGIQRKYGLDHRRFSLFNTHRWSDPAVRPVCCDVVPVLYAGMFHSYEAQWALDCLASRGSKAAPGFMKPEGIIIYHHAAGQYFKKTIEKDEEPKQKAAA